MTATATPSAAITLRRGTWTEAELHQAFDAIKAPGSHWKDAQAGQVVGCRAANLLADSLEFFHGAETTLVVIAGRPNDQTLFRVSSPGYAAW